jgi:hypothetical protein
MQAHGLFLWGLAPRYAASISFAQFDHFPQLSRHGHFPNIRLIDNRIEDLFEPLVGAKVEVNEQDFSTFEHASPATASGKPFLAELVAKTLGNFQRFFQQFDGVHRPSSSGCGEL